MRAWACVALTILLALPPAAAEAVTGKLVAEGQLVLPEGTLASGPPTALFLGDTQGLIRLQFFAPRLHVEDWYENSTGLPTSDHPLLGDSLHGIPASWDLTGAKGDLQGGDASGWMGAYFDGRQVVEATSQGRMNLSAQTKEKFGEVTDPQAGSAPDQPHYNQDQTSLHLSWEVPGALRITGPWTLKLEGPDVRISSDQNVTSITTGKEHQFGGFRIHEEWLTLTAEGDGAYVTIESAAPVRLATPLANVAWVGSAEVEAVSGALTTPTATYSPTTRQPVTLEGSLHASLVPSDPEMRFVDVILRGDLQSSTLGATVHEAPFDPASPKWLGSILGGLTLLVGLAVGLHVHARKGRPLTVDQLLELADRAAEDGKFEVAREWSAKALALMPDHPRVLIDHGFFSAQCGETQEALDAYVKASALSDSGEPEFLAAQLLLKRLGKEGEAADWLLKALEKAPELLFEIEETPEFKPLLRREDVRLAVGRAQRRGRT